MFPLEIFTREKNIYLYQLPDVAPWVTITMMLLSKMFITISFLVIYVQCAEVYPTTHRACGTGLSSLVSSCIGVIVPYIAYVVSFLITLYH